MSKAYDDVLSRALMLPVLDRALLAKELLESLTADDIDEDVRKAWATEIEIHLTELRAASAER